jgi:hypothetical protein
MTRDQFAKRKHDWLDQVRRDRSLPPMAFHVAYSLATYLNRDSGDAFPAQETIAADVDIEARSVRRLVEHLIRGGHLVVTEAHGRGRSNLYRPIMKSRGNGSGFEDPGTGNQLPLFEADNRTDRSGIEPKNRTDRSGIEAVKPDSRCNKTGPAGPTNLKENLITKNRPSNGSTTGTALVATKVVAEREIVKAFEDWWAAYPRKQGKKAAQVAYGRIVSKGEATIAELLAGAKRYAAECAGKEPRYIKLPAGWLNDGRWADEGEGTAAIIKPTAWPECVELFKRRGFWPSNIGPQPGQHGCRAPPDVLHLHGYPSSNMED